MYQREKSRGVKKKGDKGGLDRDKERSKEEEVITGKHLR